MIYLRKGKRLEQNCFTDTLQTFIRTSLKEECEHFDIQDMDLIFNLGSLIHPKQMLKLLKDHARAKVNVVNIYNYLYKFSLERLQQFLNNKCLMLLFVNYLNVNGFTRVHQSSNMTKYRLAYYEACHIMIQQSSHC